MVKGDLVRRSRDGSGYGVVVRVKEAETFNGHIYHVMWANSDTVYWYSRDELENVNKCKDLKKMAKMT